MRKWIAVVVALALLASCATMGRWWSVINTSKLHVGMTKPEVEAATPLAKTVNRTVVRGVTMEQWVFKNAAGMPVYLYLENGILVGWQD